MQIKSFNKPLHIATYYMYFYTLPCYTDSQSVLIKNLHLNSISPHCLRLNVGIIEAAA